MGKLPDCMMPDGGDCCVAYHELWQENQRLKKSIKQYLDCQTTNQWVRHFKKALEGTDDER